MNHTSGFSTIDGNRLHGIGGDDPKANEYAVRALADSRPQAAPGEQFQYSNANYIVLGHVIEKIALVWAMTLPFLLVKRPKATP